METKLSSAEQDRADKDEQIRSLREEMQHQNDMVSKLQKDKKGSKEGHQKLEDLLLPQGFISPAIFLRFVAPSHGYSWPTSFLCFIFWYVH